MFHVFKIMFIAVSFLFLASCNKGLKEKNQELEEKIAKLEEFVNLPKEYGEELKQAVTECNELTKTPNADPAAVAAAKKKLEDLEDRLKNEGIVLTGELLSVFEEIQSNNCIYEEWQDGQPDSPEENGGKETAPGESSSSGYGPQPRPHQQ